VTAYVKTAWNLTYLRLTGHSTPSIEQEPEEFAEFAIEEDQDETQTAVSEIQENADAPDLEDLHEESDSADPDAVQKSDLE